MSTATRPTGIRRAWCDRAEELAAHFENHWVVRRDCFGGYYVGKDGKHRQRTSKDPLTHQILVRHCRAKGTAEVIGIHTTVFQAVEGLPHGGVCLSRWFCVDIDHHGDEDAPEANQRAAVAWYGVLTDLGFRPLLIDSNGSGGYRLYVFFNEPLLTERVRRLGRWLIRDWLAQGLAGEPEVFPKQDTIQPPGSRDGTFGNWVRLPGRHYKRDHWSSAWNGSEFVSGNLAVDLILSITGDSPVLIPDGIGDYGKAALLDEVAKGAAATEGHRHDTVRNSALKLESLVKAGELSDGEAAAGACAMARGNRLESEGRMDEVDVLLESARRKATPRTINKKTSQSSVNGDGHHGDAKDERTELEK